MPFQYPPGSGEDDADRVHYYQSSVRSIKHFHTERAFYLEMITHPHPNITQLLGHNLSRCIVLEHLSPLEEAWRLFDDDQHTLWIIQLLNAVTFLESKGILHGDLAVRNMGTGKRCELKLFDFGSIVRATNDDYQSQLLDDYFDIATCIHFLLSGVDPLNDVETIAQQRRHRKAMEQGLFEVARKAEPFQHILQNCWTTAARISLGTFSVLRDKILTVIDQSGMRSNFSQQVEVDPESIIEVDLEIAAEWKDYEEFRSQWKSYLALEEMDDDLIV